MSNINIKNMYLKYNNSQIDNLKDINLEIEDGEFVVFIGPSGCGKSTTLKALLGLEEPYEGEIVIGDQIVNYLEPKDRNMSMVFQNYALYPHMNISKNISFGLKNKKISKSIINERVEKYSKMLQIEEYLDKYPGDLSGGQQQRVALARALANDPKILLFDEPLSNLDAKLRTKTRYEIINLHKQLKKTFIYVTHDQVEAMTMADKIVLLRAGEIEQVGKPLELFYKPKNLFVAKFIGSPEINVIKGKREGSSFVNEFLKVELTNEELEKTVDKNEYFLGIRADDIDYSFTPKDDWMELDIYGKEILGNTTNIYAKINDCEIGIVTRTITGIMDKQKIYINVSLARKLYFDGKTEEHIIYGQK